MSRQRYPEEFKIEAVNRFPLGCHIDIQRRKP